MPETDDITSRILDAAERLIVRYGYDKTTLEEIAREAGIARSTLYSRWKKKDMLAAALIWRGSRRYMDRLLARVEADPNGGTFAGLYRNGLLALNDDAFMLALYRQEQKLLGSLLLRPDIDSIYIQRNETSKVFLRLMQQAGTARMDLDIDALAVVFASLQYGYLKMSEFMVPGQPPTVERVVEVCTEMINAYIAPPGGGDSDAGKVAIRQYFDQVNQQLDKLEKLAGPARDDSNS